MPASAAALRDGWKVVQVARRLLVCCQSVHNWIARYQQGGLTAEPRRIECQLARAGVGAVPSRSSIYRYLKRHGLIDLRRRRTRREDFGRWERDRLMQLWQIDVMGGVMPRPVPSSRSSPASTQITELQALQALFPPVSRPGGEEDVVARRPSRRRASEP